MDGMSREFGAAWSPAGTMAIAPLIMDLRFIMTTRFDFSIAN
jgi:hypothetical protein